MNVRNAKKLRVGNRVSVPVCGVQVEGTVTAMIGDKPLYGVTIVWDDGVTGSLDFRDMKDVIALDPPRGVQP